MKELKYAIAIGTVLGIPAWAMAKLTTSIFPFIGITFLVSYLFLRGKYGKV